MRGPYRVHLLTTPQTPHDSCVLLLQHANKTEELLHLHSEHALAQRCVTSRPRDLTTARKIWWFAYLTNEEDWRVANP